jgi:hypothetical protein
VLECWHRSEFLPIFSFSHYSISPLLHCSITLILHPSITPLRHLSILRRQRCRLCRYFTIHAKKFNNAFNNDPEGNQQDDDINDLQKHIIGCSEFNLVQNDGPDGHHRHKDRRQSGNHPFQATPGFQIEGDNNQRQGSQGLVDGPKQRPQFQGTLAVGPAGKRQYSVPSPPPRPCPPSDRSMRGA